MPPSGENVAHPESRRAAKRAATRRDLIRRRFLERFRK
jgi:hypothetical protein